MEDEGTNLSQEGDRDAIHFLEYFSLAALQSQNEPDYMV